MENEKQEPLPSTSIFEKLVITKNEKLETKTLSNGY